MRALVVLLLGFAVALPARGDELAGAVLDDAGRPAAGATISAAAIHCSPPLRLTTTCDERGMFCLDLPRQKGDTRYALAVRYQNQGADLTETLNFDGKTVAIAGQALPNLTIHLRPAGVLRGRLLQAEDGEPIDGARLFFDTGEVLTTDEGGCFEIHGLPMKSHSMIPSARGQVRQYVIFDTTLDADAELEIRLPRGAVLRGRVVDESGKPVVEAYFSRRSSGTALTLNGWDEAVSVDGRFEYGGLSPNRLFYSLCVSAPEYKIAGVDTAIDSAMETIDRDIVLQKMESSESPNDTSDSSSAIATSAAELPRHTIRGQIFGEGGNPVNGAEVRWGSFSWDDTVKNAKSDTDGKFDLTKVPAAKGAIFVLADGYAPQFVAVMEQTESIDINLARGMTVRGRVTGSKGQPVAGVQVIPQTSCWETGYCNPIWLSERSTSTDEQGLFELSAIPVVGVTFDFVKEGYSNRREVHLKPGDDLNEVALTTGGAVHGLVLNADGEPVRNFKIRVMIPRERSPTEQVGGYYAGFDWYGVVFTRSDGEFVLSDVPAHAVLRLIVSGDEGVGIVDRAITAPLDALPAANELTIKLQPYRALNVTVIAKETKLPVARALVSLAEDEPNLTESFRWGYHDLWAERRRTDENGVAHFSRPACQDGTLFTRAPGFARKRLVWHGDEQLKVELDVAAKLAGEVWLYGKPLSEGYVRVSTALNDFLGVDLEATPGEFEFLELPAGECSLSVSGGANQVLHTQRITLAPGENRQLQLRLTSPTEPADKK